MSAIPAALAAINTLLQVGDGNSPQNFLTVANIGDMNPFTMSTDVVDVTSHSTGVPWSQKFATLLNAGDITAPCFFVPSSTNSGTALGHEELLYLFTARAVRTWRIVFPDLGPTIWSCQGFLSKFSMKAPVKGVETADITITLTGQPTLVETTWP